MTMQATARRVADTLEHEVDVNGRHVIVTDEPEPLGGTDRGPAPHELLPAVLAACAATAGFFVLHALVHVLDYYIQRDPGTGYGGILRSLQTTIIKDGFGGDPRSFNSFGVVTQVGGECAEGLAQGQHVATEVREPDGSLRRVTFDKAGYPLSDAYDIDQPDPQ